MSTFSTLLIHRSEAELEDSITSIIEQHADAEADVFRRSGEVWIAEFEGKSTVDGLEGAAEVLSLVLACQVDVVEEWDNRDADDAGREAYSYDRGKKILVERALMIPPGKAVNPVVITRLDLEVWIERLTEQPVPDIDEVLADMRRLLA